MTRLCVEESEAVLSIKRQLQQEVRELRRTTGIPAPQKNRTRRQTASPKTGIPTNPRWSLHFFFALWRHQHRTCARTRCSRAMLVRWSLHFFFVLWRHQHRTCAGTRRFRAKLVTWGREFGFSAKIYFLLWRLLASQRVAEKPGVSDRCTQTETWTTEQQREQRELLVLREVCQQQAAEIIAFRANAGANDALQSTEIYAQLEGLQLLCRKQAKELEELSRLEEGPEDELKALQDLCEQQASDNERVTKQAEESRAEIDRLTSLCKQQEVELERSKKLVDEAREEQIQQHQEMENVRAQTAALARDFEQLKGIQSLCEQQAKQIEEFRDDAAKANVRCHSIDSTLEGKSRIEVLADAIPRDPVAAAPPQTHRVLNSTLQSVNAFSPQMHKTCSTEQEQSPGDAHVASATATAPVLLRGATQLAVSTPRPRSDDSLGPKSPRSRVWPRPRSDDSPGPKSPRSRVWLSAALPITTTAAPAPNFGTVAATTCAASATPPAHMRWLLSQPPRIGGGSQIISAPQAHAAGTLLLGETTDLKQHFVPGYWKAGGSIADRVTTVTALMQQHRVAKDAH